jgi:hypothetical protein
VTADVPGYIMLVARLLSGDNKNSSTEKYGVSQMKVPAITADQSGNICPGSDSFNRSDAGSGLPRCCSLCSWKEWGSTGKFAAAGLLTWKRV